MTPSPGTICRSTSTISARRRRTASSGAGTFIGGDPTDLATLGSALARLISRIGLIDDECAPLSAHDAAVLVAFLQRLQRIDDLHALVPRRGLEHRKGGRRSQTQGPNGRGQDLPTELLS